MRRLHFAAGVTGVVVAALMACTRDRASSDAADAGSASSATSDTAAGAALDVPSVGPSTPRARVFPDSPPPKAPPPAPGTPVVGNSCSPGRDSIACTADALTALTCAGGQWRMLEPCRGPGHCAGVGAALTCDTGLPQPGDACVPAKSEPQCRSANEAITCLGGKWLVSPCAAGTLCTPGGPRGHAGCK
ncbi:MAG: hypothetical protein ABSE49_15490 [Polyangiaceae bacterium]